MFNKNFCSLHRLVALNVILLSMGSFAVEYFVDINRPDDNGDGTTEETAFKTIQAAVSREDATVVTVLPGTYTRGEATTVDGNGFAACVFINKKITLKSKEGRESTFIVGQHGESNGIGEGAVRCIIVSADAVGSEIEGFTICNGAAPNTSGTGRFGGGVYVADKIYKVFFNDCIISNCVANRGGAVHFGSYERCLFMNNYASSLGSVGFRGRYRNCIFYKNDGGTAECFGYVDGFINCAFVENKGLVLSTHNPGATVPVYNCVFSKNTGAPGVSYYCYSNCVFYVVESKVGSDMRTDCVYGAVDSQYRNPSLNDWRVRKGSATETAGNAKWLFGFSPFEDRPFKDCYGNVVTKTEGIVCAGPVQTVSDGSWYVDAKKGSDDNDGFTPEKPKRTLKAALSDPRLLAGDVVHAAPGVYDDGEMQYTTASTVKSRAHVPKGITLVADAGPKETFIIGKSASSELANEYGLGADAVRCVALEENAKIIGFTLTGGRTHKKNESMTVEGQENSIDLKGQTASAILGFETSDCTAENCIITGNVAYSASITECHVVNSLIFDNHATYRRSVGYNMSLSGCVIDRNTGPKPIEYFEYVRNCTIGPNNDNTPVIRFMREESKDKPRVINTLILSGEGSVDDDVAAKNSIFVKGCGVNTELLTDCTITNIESLAVNESFIPVLGANVAVDAANRALFNEALCGNKDVYGHHRVANGDMDIGAVETPWLERYAHDLSGFGIAVTNASPMVVETESGNVSILDGRLDLEWHNSSGREFKHVIPVKVTGTGRLVVYLDDKILGEVTVEKGNVELNFRNAQAVNRLSFVYEPGENDEGCAVIGALKRQIGHIIVIR